MPDRRSLLAAPPSLSPDSTLLTHTWLKLIDNVIHHLKTPICSISSLSNVLEEIFPPLVKGYQLASQTGMVEHSVDQRILHILQAEGFGGISHDVQRLLQFLQALRQHTKTACAPRSSLAPLSIQNQINQLLVKYHFNSDEERSWIHTTINPDFEFYCPPIFIECLLDHLLSNACRALRQNEQEEKKKIEIWTEAQEMHNALCFQDNGCGIAENYLPTVFSRFFSERDGQTVPGLGFCQLALLQVGASLTCSSQLGQYTQFVLHFPTPT